uniref:Uncharacterized protein n=1 Tax=Arundo donax TaxID=35708 RepID=A0A0A9HB76_ARUDO
MCGLGWTWRKTMKIELQNGNGPQHTMAVGSSKDRYRQH